MFGVFDIGAWLFQGNPEYVDLDGALTALS
jgi:hypothetical protein